MELIEIKPLGTTFTAKLRILEDKRPRCCPDLACKPFLVQTNLQEELDKGFSGECWGYCGEQAFNFKEAEHRNDLSQCIMTPYKGVARFFLCYTDLMSALHQVGRAMHLLRPRYCDECTESQLRISLVNYFDRSEPHNEFKRRELCLGCAVRLGWVEFHPENIGTGRSLYF